MVVLATGGERSQRLVARQPHVAQITEASFSGEFWVANTTKIQYAFLIVRSQALMNLGYRDCGGDNNFSEMIDPESLT